MILIMTLNSNTTLCLLDTHSLIVTSLGTIALVNLLGSYGVALYVNLVLDMTQ
jgi:hypothetical protein